MGKVKCEVCNKKCGGDILKADQKYFHIACFACKTCHRPLSEVGFFVQDGKYYCPNDYHAQYGKVCPVCKQFVEGDVVECMGETFHGRCFKCHRCRRQFPSGENVTFTGKEYMCFKCFQMISQQQAVPVATVKPTLIDQAQGVQSVAPTADASALPVCASCSHVIHKGQVLMALDAAWHIWCFKCTACDSVLHGEYMTREGQPYCIRDYNAQYGVKCYECDQFITGKVLQAGGYRFHQTCASCSRCNDSFSDGEEMYMQGDEIWHPRCDDLKPSDKIMHGAHKSPRSSFAPKYSVDFGKHLTYSYLLPEPSPGYLRHPIQPNPPPPPMYHTPQGPIKIRKSRISMLKTGMQRLTETLDEDRPRPKSPHMDNEEPIEMSHYPSGRAPEPDEIPAIERDDFPAPPYPYAVEELKRRLSESSLHDDVDQADEVDAPQPADEDKIHKAEEELKKYEKDSSIVKVLKEDLEEKAKKNKYPLFWDPRSASRTPAANKMPLLRCRYETPINASPSRYENRPKPWIYWKILDKSATATLPAYQWHIPKPGYGLAPKASTLPGGAIPDAYLDGVYFGGMDQTLTGSQYSDGGALGSIPVGGKITSAGQGLRTSLPDMSKPPKVYPYEQLNTGNKDLPEDVDRCHLERHLTKEDFERTFKMTPLEFYKLPDWKRINLKRKFKLF